MTGETTPASVMKNIDLRTLSKVVSTAVATLGAGAVPAGMRRYVTMVRVNNIAGANNTIYLCSSVGSANVSTVALASAAQKFAVLLAAGETQLFPPSVGDVRNPLFIIAASGFINARANNGQVRLFMQYYDQ